MLLAVPQLERPDAIRAMFLAVPKARGSKQGVTSFSTQIIHILIVSGEIAQKKGQQPKTNLGAMRKRQL